MFGRSAGILTLTACALRASAFLIPAGLTPTGDNVASALTLSPNALHAKHVALKLPCSECVFSSKHEEKAEDVEDGDATLWIQGGANSVVVNISISEDGQRLELNGQSMYPASHSVPAQRMYVDQVPASASVEDIEHGKVKTARLEVTGSGLAAMSEETAADEGHTMITFLHSIFAIESQLVSLDDIAIHLLKTDAGELFIMHAAPVATPKDQHFSFVDPASEDVDNKDKPWPRPHHGGRLETGNMFGPPPHHGHHGHGHMGPPGHRHKECSVLPPSLCKIAHSIEDKVRGMRKGGCRGRKHGGHGPKHPMVPHFRPDREDMRPHHHGRPHHMRPHGHHGHHHRGHHFMHSFIHSLAAVIIPTMAGIAVGMFVSLIGVLVGRLICFLWIKFYRGGRRGGYQSVRLDETSDEQTENEKILVVEELSESEPLPVYEQAPAYEETEKEVK